MKFTQHLRALSLLSASVLASTAFAATPSAALVSQEVWAGPEPVVTGQPVSRAEVQADLLLWKQAGLDAYYQGESAFGDHRTYEAQLAQYQQQRNSAVFAQQVQRIQAAAQ